MGKQGEPWSIKPLKKNRGMPETNEIAISQRTNEPTRYTLVHEITPNFNGKSKDWPSPDSCFTVRIAAT